jgi:hypothetical protein
MRGLPAMACTPEAQGTPAVRGWRGPVCVPTHSHAPPPCQAARSPCPGRDPGRSARPTDRSLRPSLYTLHVPRSGRSGAWVEEHFGLAQHTRFRLARGRERARSVKKNAHSVPPYGFARRAPRRAWLTPPTPVSLSQCAMISWPHHHPCSPGEMSPSARPTSTCWSPVSG